MAIGRILGDMIEAIGPIFREIFDGIASLFSGAGELVGALLPETIKVFGYYLGIEQVLIGIAAMLIPILLKILWSRRREQQQDPKVPKARISSFIWGLCAGLLMVGTIYVLWRSNVGGYKEFSRIMTIAPVIGVPVLIAAFVSQIRYWRNKTQAIPLALIVGSMMLTAYICIADFKVDL